MFFMFQKKGRPTGHHFRSPQKYSKLLKKRASVAQWQSYGFVNRGSSVQVRPLAPKNEKRWDGRVRLKAPVLKTGWLKPRGFKSFSHRHSFALNRGVTQRKSACPTSRKSGVQIPSPLPKQKRAGVMK